MIDEKNINLFDIQRFCLHDGPGIRTTFFMKGCPLSCKWCHNPEGRSPSVQLQYLEEKCIHCGLCAKKCPAKVHHFTETGEHRVAFSDCILCGNCVKVCPAQALRLCGYTLSAEQVLAEAKKDLPYYSEEGGITFSGGEPTMQMQALLRCVQLLSEEGIQVCIDTCGFTVWESYAGLLPYTQKFLYDLKGMDEKKHLVGTGETNQIIWENLEKLLRHGASVWIRIPVIPGYNASETDFRLMADRLKQLDGIQKITMIPYHTLGSNKYAQIGWSASVIGEVPKKEELRRYQMIFAENGLPIEF